MRTLDVERLVAGDYAQIKPLLVELHLTEQIHYEDHPQLPREEIERHLASVPAAFQGENVIYVVRDEVGRVVGFCWIKLYSSVGFEPNRQLVMTWYPIDPVPES